VRACLLEREQAIAVDLYFNSPACFSSFGSSKLMLKTVLRIHSVAAASYAVVLLFFPTLFWQLTAKDPATDFGLSVAQLLGAPMIVMTCVTWIASTLSDPKVQRSLACALLLYLCTGFVVTLVQQLQGKWGTLGWSSPLSYACFSALYTIALLRKRTVAVS
jgi:hypothetical protein